MNIARRASARGRRGADAPHHGARRRARPTRRSCMIQPGARRRPCVAMQAAEEKLVKGEGRDALPPEQRALQHLQRAEAMYRDVQVQIGPAAGRRWRRRRRQAANAEDLADLFELQTDKLRNQYEAVQQRVAAAAAERAGGRRRARAAQGARAADSSRRTSGCSVSPSRCASSSGQQRQRRWRWWRRRRSASWRDEAEEEARRLERLAREQRSTTRKSPRARAGHARGERDAIAGKAANDGGVAQGRAGARSAAGSAAPVSRSATVARRATWMTP